MIEITKATGQSFLLYRELTYSLHRQGLVFLAGLNGEGKSCALSLIPWVLWGKLLRSDKREADVTRVIHHGDDTATGRVEGTIEGTPFWVERERTRKGSVLRSSFSSNSRADQDQQRDIDRYLSTFEAAENTTIMAQNRMLKFLSVGDDGRRQILDELLMLGPYRNALQAIRTDAQWLMARRKEFVDRLAEIERYIEGTVLEIHHRAELAQQATVLRVEALQARLAELVADRQRTEQHREVAESKVTAIRPALYEGQRALNEARQRRSEWQNSLTAMRLHLNQIEAAIQAGGICYACRQPIPAHDLSALQVAKSAVVEQIRHSEQSQAGAELVISLRELEEGLFANHGEMTKLNQQIADCDSTLLSYESTRTKLEAEIAKIQADSAGFDWHSQLNDLTPHQRGIDKLKAMLEMIDKIIQVLAYWETAMGAKGIPAMLLAESLPLVNSLTNDTLYSMADGRYSFAINPTYVGTSKEIDRLTIVVQDGPQEVYFGELSPGQQKLAMVCLFLAFAQASLGAKWGFRILDELFDALDSEKVERAIMTVKGQVSDGSIGTVVMTSHHSHIGTMDAFNQVWSVKREGTASTLTMG